MPLLKAGLALAVVIVFLIMFYRWADGNGYNRANVRAEKVVSDVLAAEAQAQRDARKAEREKQAAVDQLGDEYQRGLNDAKTAEDGVIADLHADNLRLRAEWRGCETGRLSGDAASAIAIAAADQRRAEAAGRIVRVGAECDARDRAWRQYAGAVTMQERP